MIRILAILLAFASSTAQAGIAGWLSSEARDWQFVQNSGGIRIGLPVEREGRLFLPIEYWPEGNSGFAVRKVTLRREGARLVVLVYTQLVEKGAATGRVHYASLNGVPAGSYDVYYEGVEPTKHLGRIEVRAFESQPKIPPAKD